MVTKWAQGAGGCRVYMQSIGALSSLCHASSLLGFKPQQASSLCRLPALSNTSLACPFVWHAKARCCAKIEKSGQVKTGQAGLVGKFCKAGEAYMYTCEGEAYIYTSVWQVNRQYAANARQSKGKGVERRRYFCSRTR